VVYTTDYASPVGVLTLASDGVNLTGLWMAGQRYFAATLTGQRENRDGLPVLLAAKVWLERYFAGEKPSAAELPLALRGSPFRQTVWQLLREIPYGEVTTYGALAQEAASRLGRETMSAQAVGGAVGHNPISIIIPCHRVVGKDGSLTGYAGGLAVKTALLRLEGVDMSTLFEPTLGSAL